MTGGRAPIANDLRKRGLENRTRSGAIRIALQDPSDRSVQTAIRSRDACRLHLENEIRNQQVRCNRL